MDAENDFITLATGFFLSISIRRFITQEPVPLAGDPHKKTASEIAYLFLAGLTAPAMWPKCAILD